MIIMTILSSLSSLSLSQKVHIAKWKDGENYHFNYYLINVVSIRERAKIT